MNPTPTDSPSPEDESKDAFHEQLSALCNAMISAHGRDFTIGTLVLAARFIVEGKPMTRVEESEAQPG